MRFHFRSASPTFLYSVCLLRLARHTRAFPPFTDGERIARRSPPRSSRSPRLVVRSRRRRDASDRNRLAVGAATVTYAITLRRRGGARARRGRGPSHAAGAVADL